METPLLLKIMLSWAIMIFCFTALFAGAQSKQPENYTPNDIDDEKEIIDSKKSKELQSDLKRLKMEFKTNKNSEDKTKYRINSGGSAVSATQRNKDSE